MVTIKTLNITRLIVRKMKLVRIISRAFHSCYGIVFINKNFEKIYYNIYNIKLLYYFNNCLLLFF